MTTRYGNKEVTGHLDESGLHGMVEKTADEHALERVKGKRGNKYIQLLSAVVLS